MIRSRDSDFAVPSDRIDRHHREVRPVTAIVPDPPVRTAVPVKAQVATVDRNDVTRWAFTTTEADPAMYEQTDHAGGFSVVMSATFAHIDEVDAALTALLTARSDTPDPFQSRLLLREALLNAVIHGCGKDDSLTVRVDVSCDDAALTMTVTDDGPGFEWGERGLEVNILGDGGRGLPLMRIYSDAVEFNDRGNQITIRKNFAGRTAA